MKSKTKILVFIIILLLLTNLAALYYARQQDRGRHSGPRHGGREPGSYFLEMLKTEVGFDEAQLARAKTTHEQHKDSIELMMKGMQEARAGLFSLVNQSNVADSVLQKATARIAERQTAMDTYMFRRFQKLRTFCQPGQLTRFDSLVQKMTSRKGRFGPPGRDGEKKDPIKKE